MREGIPSGTSFAVSLSRGLGVEEPAIDPVARELLPFWLGWLADAPGKLGGAAPLLRWAMRASSLGLVDHAVLRTQAIDAHVSSALESGIDQLVLLGAGLDARAWRLPELAQATVFEVDHPATQEYKRARTRGRAPHAEIRFVAVDFEREGFAGALETSGFRSGSRALWIWEGVSMYLRKAAILDTLAQMSRLSAPGSELAMTYRVPGTLPFGPLGHATIPVLFRAMGEPLRGTLTSEELASTLAPNWEVLADENSHGWKRLTRSRARPARAFLGERLAIARRA